MTQLLENTVCGAVMILAVAALRRGMGDRLAPGARLALWAACLFRLFTPAAPECVLSFWRLFGREAAGDAPAAANSVNYTPQAAGPYAPAEPYVPAPGAAQAGISWEMALAAVWIAVGAALAAGYAVRWARTRRAVARTIPISRGDPRYGALPRCARLREGPMDGAPLTFGVARPTVVLFPGLEGAQLECVLAHEGVHARRRDNLWHYAMALALIVHWWNPAVWLMARLARRDVELSCDRAAVRKLGVDRRAEYANALVSMATRGKDPAFCQTFGRKAAEERIVSIMKYRKTTIIGAALTLALVLAVTVGFASSPAEKKTSGELLDKPVLAESAMQNEDGTVTEYTVNLDALKQNLDRHVAEGTMTQAEADRVWEQAQEFVQGGKALTWAFQGDSGLTLDELHNVCYRDENGKLIPVDPATVVSGFIFPAADTVVYHGRTFNRADLSQETLEWLDWYLALSEEEQLAVSYEPWELRDRKTVTEDAEQAVPELVPDYDPSTQDSARLPVCPAEGCTVQGVHTHDGVIYRCNGAHCGGVCDGSCATAWNEADTTSNAPAGEPGLGYDPRVEDSAGICGLPLAPSESEIPEFVPNYDPNVEDSIGAGEELIEQSFPSRTGCYPDESGHHGGNHH